jgi:transposase
MPSSGKSRKREQAIIALLNTRTIADAAQMAGVSLRTMKRWLADPEFKAQFERAKSELLRTATAKLRREASTCVEVLARIAQDEKAPPAARVSASTVILKFALDAETQEVLEERLRRLEEQSNENS